MKYNVYYKEVQALYKIVCATSKDAAIALARYSASGSVVEDSFVVAESTINIDDPANIHQTVYYKEIESKIIEDIEAHCSEAAVAKARHIASGSVIEDSFIAEPVYR